MTKLKPSIQIKMVYLKGYKRIKKISINYITTNFYKNLKCRGDCIYSFVEYNKMKCFVGFYDMKQAEESLHKMVGYFYAETT